MAAKNRLGWLALVALFGSGVAACSGADVSSEEATGSAQEELKIGKLCGGPRDRQCGKGQYCSTRPGACADDGAFGRCVARPEICYKIYKPVCGCDGKTYGNDCEAAAAGTSVASQGVCEPQFCGGIAGIPCPDGQTCVDDPNDGCDPKNGGADCGGICVTAGEPCGEATCGAGLTCCNPLLGICTKPGMVCIQ